MLVIGIQIYVYVCVCVCVCFILYALIFPSYVLIQHEGYSRTWCVRRLHQMLMI